MAEDKFIRRLQLLKQSGCHVLGLQSAVAALKAGTLPDNTVVLTADDGYLNSPQTLVKHCNRFQYPLTIYVTSYYSQNRNPIFNAMVYYMLWKTQKTVLVGEFPFADKPGQQHWDLTGSQQKLLAKQIIDYGRNHCSEEQRRELSENLSTALGLDFSLMDDEGICKLMGKDEITTLAKLGTDIQLHTHRHRFPVDQDTALKEICQNRQYLSPLVNTELNHFCYPSGRWSTDHHPWLESMGVTTATTLQIGFNDANTHLLALKRYLDKQDITETEFLAEISGFNELLRMLRRRVKMLWN